MSKLNEIIEDYKRRKKESPDTWSDYCKKTDLEEVIEKAGLAINPDGRRNAHQRRLTKVTLNEFKTKLLAKQKEIEKAETFEELLNLVENCRIKGIGELTCYDTAKRIGAKLNIYPAKVYLHAGTRIGAKAFIKTKDKYIDRSVLPAPFHDKELTDDNIEDILCIYKYDFESKSDFKVYCSNCSKGVKKGKRIICSLIILFVFICLNATAQTWPPAGMAGTGTETNPWEITTAEHLADLAAYVYANSTNVTGGKYYKLMNDIDLQSYTDWVPIGVSLRNPITYNPFRGNFDGNGKVIRNLIINTSNTNIDDKGLFGYASDGTIQNLGVEDCRIRTNGYRSAGGLVGYYNSGTISNCYVTGIITRDNNGTPSGGLVGICTNNATISNCHFTGIVNGYGGLVGRCATNATISGCYVTGTVNGYGGLIGIGGSGTISGCYVTGTVNGRGGLIGDDFNGTISDCYVSANVSGTGNKVGGLVPEVTSNQTITISNCNVSGSVTGTGDYVGGLVGYTAGPCNISYCYTDCSVTGTEYVGGFVGRHYSGSISNSYASGMVKGTGGYVGGLVGYSRSTTFSNCYTTCDVSGSSCIGGICGAFDAGSQVYSNMSYCYATGTIKGRGAIGGLLGGIFDIYNTSSIKNCIAVNDSIISTGNFTSINRIAGYFRGTILKSYALNTMVLQNSNGNITPSGDLAGISMDIQTLKMLSFYTASGNWSDGAWDITDPSGIWKICDGHGLPYLRWQGIECILPPLITTTTLPNGVTGTAYSAQLNATGNTPITWSLASGNLPNGLTVSTAGIISGTPTAAGTFNFTVLALNSVGSDTKALYIVVNAPPVITTTTLPSGLINTAYSTQLAATGTTPITWSLESGSLPTGLTLSSAGVISGTPTVLTTSTFTVKATNSAGSATKTLYIVVNAPPVITTTTLPEGMIGDMYSTQLEATGSQPITWSLASGSLPTGGLTLSAAGVISGTPTQFGNFNFTVQATNSFGNNTKALSIRINGRPPTITTTSLPNGTVGMYYNQTLTATGTTPITWLLTSGSLPTGLVIQQTSGKISGTPLTAGTYNFTVQATNSFGNNTKALSIVVAAATAPVITTTTLPGGTTGTAYSTQLAAIGSAPITWSLSSGSLPNGLTLSASGVISGTPTAAGTSNFTVKATNSAGNATKALSIVITAATVAPTITTTTLPGGTTGTAYSQTLAVTGTAPITWSLASGSLPNGLTLSASGVISGTPTEANSFNFTVKATNSAGSNTKALSIKIENGVGVEENETGNIDIYPNPTTGELRIESGELRVENVVIYDVFGKIQKTENGKMENTIDISHLATGIYFVKIRTESGEIARKVLKE